MLQYYRGIFLAITISKIFESLIKERIQANLAQINLLQAGSRTKRGAPDNTFLLRGCIDHYVANKQPLFITTYDYEQAFDSLWVEKCILALNNLGVPKEILQLIYNLNKKAEVIVTTPHGLSDSFETDPIVKQGTVLGSALCSSSTGEYCGMNKGVPIGNMMLSSLLYVDDLLDLTTTLTDRERSHENSVLFSYINNLSLSGSKCLGMAINNDGDLPPPLQINEEKKVIPAHEIVYLGDVFNDQGNNDSLIKDRVRRGTKAIICITALIRETSLGIFEVSVWLLLYHSLFIPTVLFNCQAWSRLRQKDIENLQTIQLKFLKRIFSLASSTPNSFLLLELGVLPIQAEIHKRQLVFLHKILQLPIDDPVNQMFTNMQLFSANGEANWWSQVHPLLQEYGLPENLETIKQLSKDTFKSMVNKGVYHVSFSKLKSECASLKKTANLRYNTFGMQEYLKVLFPNQAKVILKSRCRTLDIKTHCTYKYSDTICRGCGIEDETLEHIINCGQAEHMDIVNVSEIEAVSDVVSISLMRTVNRIHDFYDLCGEDDRQCDCTS